jgi:two-component system, NarL family, response regulator
MPIRIAIADDHPIVRMGLRTLIGTEPDMEMIGDAADGRQAVALYAATRPDVMLMDLRMPSMDGTDAIRAIRSAHPDARIVALTTYEGDADITRALDAGACGYLIKGMMGPELLGAIRQAAEGLRVIPPAVGKLLAEFESEAALTAREVEVLQLAAKGLTNRDIARVMSRSENTVKMHLKNLMAKLGVADRTEAVTLALGRGIIHLGE